MNMFADLKNNDVQDEEKDSLGRQPLESGIYDASIKVAYVVTSADTGAVGITVVFVLANGNEHRETFWVKSGKAKGGKNYYVNAKGEKKFLPGFLLVDGLCSLASGKDLTNQDIQEKTLNVYNPDAKKEVPTKVPVLMSLLNTKVKLGVLKCIENKQVKDSTGKYVPTAETRTTAEVDKVFSSDGMTIVEKKAGAEKPAFIEAWKTKWEGQEKDKCTFTGGSVGVSPVIGQTAGGFMPAPQSNDLNSLFN